MEAGANNKVVNCLWALNLCSICKYLAVACMTPCFFILVARPYPIRILSPCQQTGEPAFWERKRSCSINGSTSSVNLLEWKYCHVGAIPLEPLANHPLGRWHESNEWFLNAGFEILNVFCYLVGCSIMPFTYTDNRRFDKAQLICGVWGAWNGFTPDVRSTHRNGFPAAPAWRSITGFCWSPGFISYFC